MSSEAEKIYNIKISRRPYTELRSGITETLLSDYFTWNMYTIRLTHAIIGILSRKIVAMGISNVLFLWVLAMLEKRRKCCMKFRTWR
jgi:hypothetical protein